MMYQPAAFFKCSFSGRAHVLETGEIPPDLLQAVFSNKDVDEQFIAASCVIEVTPEKDFITYGVGVTRLQMRDPEKSRASAPVNGKNQPTSMTYLFQKEMNDG